MNRSIFYLILFLLAASCGQKKQAEVSIVPKPVSVSVSGGGLEWGGPVHVTSSGQDEIGTAATYLKEVLASRNISVADDGATTIDLQLVKYDTLVPEGFYRLLIKSAGITIESNTGAGLFYGSVSLFQILPGKDQEGELPLLEIRDYPRFPYRGLNLDVSRHFFSVSFVKQYIDWLAFHKLNYFHWHLTDDQGWRIEIKKYPKLQEVAAFRNETLVGHYNNQPQKYDGQRYGGYYTQEEIKEVVQYAADRFVTVIPEIELPGHALAALAAYPNLGCTGGPYSVGKIWGVHEDVFCAGKDETFLFLQDVLDEVTELFPSHYIHIGGDECPKVRWEKCPNCQKRMKREGLKDEHELQSYFIQRIEKYLNTKGRKIIGWDEILEGGLAPNATVMSWRGEEGGIAAANQNHDVIMTPTGWCYFDYYQDSSKQEPLAIGGYLPLKMVYQYEPVPSALSRAEAGHILGTQGNLWTEYLSTPEAVEYMVYPRASALAEVAWSPKASKDYDDFLRRMKSHLNRLAEHGIHYARHIEKEIESLKTESK